MFSRSLLDLRLTPRSLEVRQTSRILLGILTVMLSNCSLFLGPEIGTDNASIFNYFWSTFDRQYALFDLKGLDWNSIGDRYRDDAVNAESSDELLSILTEMIRPMNDAHVSIWGSQSGILAESWIQPIDYSHHTDSVLSYLDSARVTGSGIVLYGMVKDSNVGYMHLSSFSKELNTTQILESWVFDADAVISEFLDTDALIIDLRGNNGGFRTNALYIASRFVTERSHYMTTKTRTGSGYSEFSAETNHYIEPRGIIYTEEVYIITDILTISAGEWFVLMLNDMEHVQHVGWRTTGALGMVVFHELPNGWGFSTTIGYTTDENGENYEGVGIPPDIPITYDISVSDPVMEWFKVNR